MAEDYTNTIHEGLEDELEQINRLEVGSEERLRAMKAMEIRYKLDLQEYELAAKLQDMIAKTELERAKLEHAKELEELAAADREAAAKAETRRFRITTALSGIGLVGSVIFAALGWATDNSENLRNNGRDRDRDRIFNVGDRLKDSLKKF